VISVVAVLCFAAVIDAQCATADHPSCASWINNGFCTNPGYSKATIQQYCPKACSNSGCANSVTNNNMGPAIGLSCPAGYTLTYLPGQDHPCCVKPIG
ncbi:hypothetical protein PENTCL1PPCAC_184, partial [Pristionchus entomophagus]